MTVPAWYAVNEVSTETQHPQGIASQGICLQDICLVDGVFGWVRKDISGQIQLIGTRNLIRRESSLHLELEALAWAMKNILRNSTM